MNQKDWYDGFSAEDLRTLPVRDLRWIAARRGISWELSKAELVREIAKQTDAR